MADQKSEVTVTHCLKMAYRQFFESGKNDLLTYNKAEKQRKAMLPPANTNALNSFIRH
jgi:hypothetical protein